MKHHPAAAAVARRAALFDGQLEVGFVPEQTCAVISADILAARAGVIMTRQNSKAKGGSGSDAITHLGDMAQRGNEASGESSRTSSLTLKAYPRLGSETQVESSLAVAVTRSSVRPPFRVLKVVQAGVCPEQLWNMVPSKLPSFFPKPQVFQQRF